MALSESPRYRYFKKIRKDGFHQYKVVPYNRRLAVKYFCLECVGFHPQEVRDCTESGVCSLFPFRLGDLPETTTAKQRAKAIRESCIECNGGAEFIADCLSPLCPLYPYRLSGNKTDTTTLIPYSEDLIILPEFDAGIIKYDEKTAV